MTATTQTDLPDHVSLGEARQFLRERIDEGHPCPLCYQHAKVYKRSINATMVRGLAAMWKEHGIHWHDKISTLRAHRVDGREESKLRYWALVEESSERREDGGHAGTWRVTETGEAFLLGRLSVRKYAHIYDSRCLRFSGPEVSVAECVREKFDLRELLSR